MEKQMPEMFQEAKYDVFISYSRKDYVDGNNVPIPGSPVAELIDFLEDHGIKCWIDKKGIYAGAEFAEVITTAICESKMLVFVSSKSSNDSIWTAGEIFEAFDRHKLIIPFKIDGASYSTRFSLLLRPLDYIDYFSYHTVSSLESLLRAIEKEKNCPRQPMISPNNSGYGYVDLGLPSGTLWATCNVGASKPSDYGDYFAWGETSPKKKYNWSNLNYRTIGDSYENVKFSKYVADSKYGTVDNKTRLELSDDAACSNWGGSWRMPTSEEWQELKKCCDCKWTKEDGHCGFKVTGNNGKSIFLPAAGCRSGDSQYDAGVNGAYWSSFLCADVSCGAFGCNFNFVGMDPLGWDRRYLGLSVRPVVSSLQ